MIRKGSLVRYEGNARAIVLGKLLSVHDVKGDTVVVWVRNDSGKWAKKAVKASDLKEVVE